MPRYKEPPQKLELAWKYYTNPTSDTFDNVMQSALKAGYSETYAKQGLHRSDMWQRKLEEQRARSIERDRKAEERRREMLEQAESNLDTTLRMETETEKELSIKHDATKFVAERVGKEYYSTRTESVNSGNEPFLQGERANVIEVTFRKYLDGQSKPHDVPRADYKEINDTSEHETPQKEQAQHVQEEE